MSGRYIAYPSLREFIADDIRKLRNLPKDVKTPAFVDSAVQEWMLLPDNAMSLGAGIFIDEEDYIKNACRIYFPENSELLRMLWKARMDLLPSDIGEFPHAFSIAWPDDFKIDGVKFPGVLVWWGTEGERTIAHKKFGKKYLGETVAWSPKEIEYGEHERMLCVSYHRQAEDIPGKYGLVSYRCVVPESRMGACLRSPEEMEEAIGELGALFTLKLDAEETRQQFMILKMVVHLMVYATACPGSVVPGWPDKYKERDVGKGFIKKFSPFKMKSPIGPVDRSSPETHWRGWHFRQYPVRKDGTRQKGLVFVTGCIVNGNVEPRTVIKV
jgi:hypothetical protein